MSLGEDQQTSVQGPFLSILIPTSVLLVNLQYSPAAAAAMCSSWSLNTSNPLLEVRLQQRAHNTYPHGSTVLTRNIRSFQGAFKAGNGKQFRGLPADIPVYHTPGDLHQYVSDSFCLSGNGYVNVAVVLRGPLRGPCMSTLIGHNSAPWLAPYFFNFIDTRYIKRQFYGIHCRILTLCYLLQLQ